MIRSSYSGYLRLLIEAGGGLTLMSELIIYRTPRVETLHIPPIMPKTGELPLDPKIAAAETEATQARVFPGLASTMAEHGQRLMYGVELLGVLEAIDRGGRGT